MGFRPLDERSLVEYIKAVPALSSKIGDKFDDLKINEVGDGNLNFVFIVVGASGSFVIKQGFEKGCDLGCYRRYHTLDVLGSQSWLMTKERAYFEAQALKKHGNLCPQHVPEVYHFDREMSLIGMRYLEPPHIIRLIAGVQYPHIILRNGHADQYDDRKAYKEWILSTTMSTWNFFQTRFRALWDENKDGAGEAYPHTIYNNPELLQFVP